MKPGFVALVPLSTLMTGGEALTAMMAPAP